MILLGYLYLKFTSNRLLKNFHGFNYCLIELKDSKIEQNFERAAIYARIHLASFLKKNIGVIGANGAKEID